MAAARGRETLQRQQRDNGGRAWRESGTAQKTKIVAARARQTMAAVLGATMAAVCMYAVVESVCVHEREI